MPQKYFVERVGGQRVAVSAMVGPGQSPETYDPTPSQLSRLDALAAALVAALLIGWVSLRLRQNEDTVIAALWAVGMATGVLFISRTPGYNADLMSYLFGNILRVSRADLYAMAVLDAAAVFIVALFSKQFLAVSFDEEFARVRGVRVEFSICCCSAWWP